MINVKEILEEITKRKLIDNENLIDSNILDSYTLINFLTILEDLDIEIPIARIDKNKLKTIESIQEYVNQLERSKNEKI